MKTLFMTKGLPASGKSTWAKASAVTLNNCKIVNKDSLRLMLDNSKWTRSNEEFVLKIRDLVVTEALNAGNHVIVDDTNLAPKHQARLEQLAKQCKARFEVQDFTHVTVDECIERDRKRSNYVGEKVIKGMYKQFLAPPIPKIEYNPELPDCIIVDIDGTAALMNGRGPYDRDKVGTDIRNEAVCQLVELYIGTEPFVIFVSGRDERCRAETELWLEEHLAPKESTDRIGYADLFMRPAEDVRKDNIIKEEIYNREIKGKYNVRFVLDDRNRVVEFWRSVGLTCFQVADGDF